jgi:hypothetical protein
MLTGATAHPRGNGTIRDSAALVAALLEAGTSEIEGLVRGDTPIETNGSPSRVTVCGATNTLLQKGPKPRHWVEVNVKQPLRIRNLM